MHQLVGVVATVLVRIPGDERPGSVGVIFDGARDTWLAYADEAFEPGQRVLVYNIRSGRAVDVMRAPVGALGPDNLAGPGGPGSGCDRPD